MIPLAWSGYNLARVGTARGRYVKHFLISVAVINLRTSSSEVFPLGHLRINPRMDVLTPYAGGGPCNNCFFCVRIAAYRPCCIASREDIRLSSLQFGGELLSSFLPFRLPQTHDRLADHTKYSISLYQLAHQHI